MSYTTTRLCHGWSTYFRDVDAIIFVLDSSDKMRMPIAKDELDQLLQQPGSCFVHERDRGGVKVIIWETHHSHVSDFCSNIPF